MEYLLENREFEDWLVKLEGSFTAIRARIALNTRTTVKSLRREALEQIGIPVI